MKKIDPDEIDKKIEEAKKAMKKKGRCYDGLGQAIEKLNKENGRDDGVILGPKNEVDYRRMLKEIEDNAADE